MVTYGILSEIHNTVLCISDTIHITQTIWRKSWICINKRPDKIPSRTSNPG